MIPRPPGSTLTHTLFPYTTPFRSPTTLPAASQDLRQFTYVQPSPSAINSYPVHVAIGECYFADEGLEVIPQSVNGSSAILQALASGQAQFGRPGPAPVIQAKIGRAHV